MCFRSFSHCRARRPRRAVMRRVKGYFALALTDSLLCRWLVLSPTGYFLSSSERKYQKTPFETHGFKTSFPRRTAQFTQASTARKNWCVETFLKCCMVSSSPSLVRLPLQNVEHDASTFQSGAAAKIEAGATPDLHQNAVIKNNAEGRRDHKTATQRRSRNPWFLAAFLSRLSFRWWKERRPSETPHL